MENQVKTNIEQKEQQLKKLSKMSMIRALLPIVGLVVVFLVFNVLTNFRMMNNMSLVLSSLPWVAWIFLRALSLVSHPL